MLRISRWIAAMVLCVAAAAFADERYVKTLSGAVTYNGGRVTIEHRFGRVSVHTTTTDQVTARATVRSSDPDIGKQVVFNVSNASNGVSIRTVFPAIHTHGEEVSYSSDLDVTIPERAPLQLRSRFGSIEVNGLRAPVDIVNGQGSIEIHDIHGGKIENSFGSITIEGSGGETSVQNANGAISVNGVRGSLSVTNRFASVSVEHVDGNLSISNANGSVSAVEIKGPTSISDSFASIMARDIGGPLSIANANGNVTAINVGGDLNVDTRFGLVRAEKVRGNLVVDNANGGVTASDINGSARVHTSFASVFLKGIDGSVDVENQNGAIGVSGLRGGCNAVSLRTTFSPIKIGLASNASYTITARTSFGQINTELPFTVTSKSISDNSSTLSGTIGNGGCHMELATANGGITIAKE